MTVHHPTPKILAAHLRDIAKLLDDHGTAAVNLAALLAARGWPASTGGEGSRSADTTSSTERAAGADQETTTPNPGHWDGVDELLARRLRLLWQVGLQVQETVSDVVAHADNDDPIAAGAGGCLTCSRVCRPTLKNPDDRLRSGLCPACRESFRRWRKDDRGDRAAFIIWRREQTKILEQRATHRAHA